MANVKFGLTLALLASAGWAIWSILSDIAMASQPDGAIGFSALMFLVTTIFSAVALFVYLRSKNAGFTKKDLSLMKYPVLAGITYGIGTLLFFELIGNNNYPFVTSVLFSAVIPSALIIKRISGQKVSPWYFIGTLIVAAGLVLQVVALYGSDFGADIGIIATAFLVLILFVCAYTCSFFVSYKGLSPAKTLLPIELTELIMLGAYGLLTNGFSALSGFSPFDWLIILPMALALVLAYHLEYESVVMLRKAKAKILNLSNILSSLELVGVVLFSTFYLDLLIAPLIAGLLLTLFGIMIVAVD